MKETAVTVWSYKALNTETYKHYLRIVCFTVGSTRYSGEWMGPSDCFWIVPGTIED